MSGLPVSVGTEVKEGDRGAEPTREKSAAIRRYAGAECLELIANCREEWMKALRRGAGGAVDLHADLLDSAWGERAVVLFSEADDEGEGARFAALAGQPIILRMLAKPRVRVRLSGHRLIGSEIVGCATARERRPFIEGMFDLVAGRETECVMVDDLEVGSAMQEALASQAGSDRRIMLHQPAASQARWWIEFGGDPGRYWEKFSKKTRETLRSKVRKLGHELVKFTSVDEALEFLKLAEEICARAGRASRWACASRIARDHGNIGGRWRESERFDLMFCGRGSDRLRSWLDGSGKGNFIMRRRDTIWRWPSNRRGRCCRCE